MKKTHVVCGVICIGLIISLTVAAQPRLCWENETPGAICAEPITGMEFVYVPGDCFQMGCDESDVECSSDEKPRHNVCLQGFWIGKYEVTNAQWQTIMKHIPSNFQGANRPVEQVSWNDAQEFLQKLNATVGALHVTPLQFRLPTEAEWEYACRAGTTTPFSFGETISTDQANYNGKFIYGNGNVGVFRGQTTDVGSFPPNGFGLYDMHGNVWEWMADTYHENHYGARKDGRAWGRLDDKRAKTLRGGSWLNVPYYARSTFRYRYEADSWSDYVGLRVVVGR